MPDPTERSLLQKAFIDPPQRPGGDQPWDSLSQEEKDALIAKEQTDRLYGRNPYAPSYLAQGMKATMEALGPKPKDTPQALVPEALVPEAQTWNQHMDTQDAIRKAKDDVRVQVRTMQEKWEEMKKAQGEPAPE